MIGWIKKHQLTAFLILAFLLSWGLVDWFWPVYLLVGDELHDFHAGRIIVLIGGFGPALAAIIISRLTSQKTADNPKWKRRGIFWIIYIVSTILVVFIELPSLIRLFDSEPMWPFIITFSSGVIPAYVWTAGLSKFSNTRKMLSSLVKPRGRFLYYLIALLIPIVVRLILTPLEEIKKLSFFKNPAANESQSLIIIYLLMFFLYILLNGAGLSEEVGWTGFATPKLQNKYSPLLASLILSVFWVAWHIPSWIAGNEFYKITQSTPTVIAVPDNIKPTAIELIISLVITLFLIRLIMTWLYNKAQGDILPGMIFHASYNFSFVLYSSPSRMVEILEPVIYGVIAIIVVVSSKMWLKLPNESDLEGQLNSNTS